MRIFFTKKKYRFGGKNSKFKSIGLGADDPRVGDILENVTKRSNTVM